jgi:hypothetical protein
LWRLAVSSALLSLYSVFAERDRRRGMSLNEAAIDALQQGLGINNNDIEYDDLDDLIGTWKDDDAFEQALADQDSTEPDLWR